MQNRIVSCKATTGNEVSAPHEISPLSFGLLVALTVSGMAAGLGVASDRWMGMTVCMGLSLVGAAILPAVRRRLQPSFGRIAKGLGAGLLLYGLTAAAAAMLFAVLPSWKATAIDVYSWRSGHSPTFIGITLPMIVLAEEMFWRGVVARFMIERCGKTKGVLFAACIYAAAHLAAFNPLLPLAALACGLYWGWLYASTDDLITPFTSHIVWDILLMFVLPVVTL